MKLVGALDGAGAGLASDHCPAMKGIETRQPGSRTVLNLVRSDHCPAMKGIETGFPPRRPPSAFGGEATTAPQ